MNDIASHMKCNVRMCVDDTKIWKVIRDVNFREFYFCFNFDMPNFISPHSRLVEYSKLNVALGDGPRRSPQSHAKLPHLTHWELTTVQSVLLLLTNLGSLCRTDRSMSRD